MGWGGGDRRGVAVGGGEIYLFLVCLQLGSVEGRLQELDLANKELTDYKYRSEAAIRELEAKLKTAEEVETEQ